MNEAQFGESVIGYLGTRLTDQYVVKGQDRLRYGLIYDAHGEVWPEKGKSIFTFKTDVLVRRADGGIPLVALELKYRKYSTDQVIAYSARGVRYKELYPYLRFGFVVGDKSVIGRKFFVHNRGFDFALVLPNAEKDLPALQKVVEDQLLLAKDMLRIVDRSKGAAPSAVTCWKNGTRADWSDAAEDESDE